MRWLDGTTFRLPPAGDLEGTYGRAGGRDGPAHWVMAQAVVTFCGATRLVAAHAESAHAPSETELVRAVLAGELAGTLAVGDMGFGLYRVVQVARHLGQHRLVRLDPRHVPGLLGRPQGAGRPRAASGTTGAITWAHRAGIACDAELPRVAVPGRVLFVRVETPGFRPLELYLFTTLPADEASVDELVALYAERWEVALRYRELKATLQMEYFDVRSAAAFEKEWEVGLLTYTLIRAAMLDTAPTRPPPGGWASPPAGRAARRLPQPYPALKGSREAARRAHLHAIGVISS